MNWIQKHYPKGQRVLVCDMRTGQRRPATVTNHTCGSGFQARHTTGIIVQFDDGQYQEISAAFLEENGGDRI